MHRGPVRTGAIMVVALQPPAIVLTAEEPAWVLITGGESFSDGEFNYFEAWTDIPGKDGKRGQRFIVCRLIVPLHVAKEVRDQASRAWEGRVDH